MPPPVKRVRRRRHVRAQTFSLSRVRLGRALLFLLALAAGFALGTLMLTTAPRAFTRWREARLLRQASAQLDHQDFDGAIKTARHVLEVQRDSLQAYLLLAEATEKENRAETVTWRAQIARLLPKNLDSLLNLASAALRFGQLETARRALDKVAPADRDRAAYHVVAGWLARAQGNDAGVEEHFAAAAKKEPANDLYQYNFAALQIRSAEPEKNSAARATLERLSKIPAFRTGSLHALLTDAVQKNDLPRADSLAQDLQMSQQVTFADLLVCLDFYRKLDEKKFAPLLEKIKTVAAHDRANVAQLMDWMNRNGHSADVLKWMEKLPGALASTPPPAIAVAAAFAEMKNWSRLKRWTHNSSWNDDEYLRLAYQALAAHAVRQSSADAEYDTIWRSAERAAGDEPEREVQLARFATKWKLTGEAEQLWSRVTKYSPARREALDALAKIYRADNDLQNLYRTAQRLHETSPNEPGASANFARLGLLLDQNITQAQRLAQEAAERAPTDVNCVMTYAFSLYGQGRSAEGIALMRKLPAEDLHEPHAAVFAAVLLLDENQPEAAKEYIAAAKANAIYPEEKKLLENALAKAAAATPTPTPSPITE